MPLRLLVREDFTAVIGHETMEFSRHDRITEPRIIGKVLASHPEYVLREQEPTVEQDNPPAVVPRQPREKPAG